MLFVRSASLFHHWASINGVANNIFKDTDDVSERFDSLEDAISNTEDLYTLL
ncbi:hypothetical protein [Niallia sp. Krafla_26]|uniref:hypothetical protein n=1 Tax=Niallia sp. Krafla_26 TaxID=3064703 RepID=UPI003D17D7A3